LVLIVTSTGVLPEALRTRCARCTKVQKEKALDVITRLYYEYPSVYTALAVRYDPTGEFTKNFEYWFDEQNAVNNNRDEGNE
jgi:Insect pheromone-binding family, A10/OS-D